MSLNLWQVKITSWHLKYLVATNATRGTNRGTKMNCILQIKYTCVLPRMRLLIRINYFATFFTKWCKWVALNSKIIDKILFTLLLLFAAVSLGESKQTPGPSQGSWHAWNLPQKWSAICSWLLVHLRVQLGRQHVCVQSVAMFCNK